MTISKFTFLVSIGLSLVGLTASCTSTEDDRKAQISECTYSKHVHLAGLGQSTMSYSSFIAIKGTRKIIKTKFGGTNCIRITFSAEGLTRDDLGAGGTRALYVELLIGEGNGTDIDLPGHLLVETTNGKENHTIVWAETITSSGPVEIYFRTETKDHRSHILYFNMIVEYN